MNVLTHSRTARNLVHGLAAALTLAAALPLHAGEVYGATAESIELGSFRGVAYYTKVDDDYRVVATLADGENGTPVRFSTTLSDRQTATMSVPGQLGASHSLEISRSGDKITFARADPSNM